MSERVVICGAGIAGVSTAYFLTVHHGYTDVILVDERAPLSLTSDKSTEAYRNFWPGPDDSMIALMNRSIELMESLARTTNNAFLLNRRGYVYVTARPDVAQHLMAAAEQASGLGAGPVRVHTSAATYTPSPAEGFEGVPDGIDVLVGREVVRALFPYLNPAVTHLFHVRRAGWLSAHQLGMFLLEAAREHGARLFPGRVVGIDCQAGCVKQVWVRRRDEGQMPLPTDVFVNAVGPLANEIFEMLGARLPVYCERHTKWMFNDWKGVLPREAPMIIWADPQYLEWSEEEKAEIVADPSLRFLLDELPPGAHLRPEGGKQSRMLLLLWAYESKPVSPHFPISFDPLFPDIVLRGVTTAIPELREYWDQAPKPVLDGGYYTRTPENLPLIGPLPVQGAYTIAALSGFGIMAACAAGELLAAHIVGAPLPSYAAAFLPARYESPAIYPNLPLWEDHWQL